MKSANEVLSQIAWDPRLAASKFTFGIYDRVADKIVELTDQSSLSFSVDKGKFFMTLDVNGMQTQIPIHRLRWVEKDGSIFWARANLAQKV